MNCNSNLPASAGRSTATGLRIARRRLDEDGEVRQDLLGAELARSWRRCLVAGLDARGGAGAVPHASAARQARACSQSEDLVRHAAPVMDWLRPQAEALGAVLLLADARGVVLQAEGDDRFASRAQRVALRPGACWSEVLRGTNAIGTALVERRPAAVHGAEHFLARHAFLCCAAAPVFDPAGGLAGVLDLSGDRRRMPAESLAVVQALVGHGAALIGRTWFEARHAHDLRVRLHRTRAGLWSTTHAALAFDGDGRWCGAEDQARAMLAPRDGSDTVSMLGLDAEALHAWAHDGQPRELTLPAQGTWWLRVEPMSRGAAARPAVPPVGDPLARRAVLVGARARLDDAGLVLLRASPDAPLRAFVRTLHEVGPRRAGPQCEVAAHRLLDASDLTAALQSAAGGTLLITGIESLPLAAQPALLSALDRAACDLVALHAAPLSGAVLAGRYRVDLQARLAAQAQR